MVIDDAAWVAEFGLILHYYGSFLRLMAPGSDEKLKPTRRK